ncbi:Serine/threonine-protein kinase RIO2 [Conexivisphaera calida]|uniref:non-specific serine/threonine protein kinase n=1 Tax=Conexivisphaera calida TaxID=1874277 RepID=A0A4P2VAD1_9ARCH|nr:Serine/threonine-protein kinase RIO2 [Conexivisphaera calida]
MREVAELSRVLSDDDYHILSSLARFLGRRRYVQVDAISKVTGRSEDAISRSLRRMHSMGLITRSSAGYSLVYAGLDALALHSLQRAGHLDALGVPIAVGKESDVYAGIVGAREVVVKAYRIGRVSFRRLKRLRIYGPRTHEWLLASMRSAATEFRNLRRLSAVELPVPKPLSLRYHLLVMDRIDGIVLRYVDEAGDPHMLIREILEAIRRCYVEARLVHADLNEFNIMVSRQGIFILDWPQAVDAGNPAAATYMERDLDNIIRFFRKRFNVALDRGSALDYVTGQAERSSPA